MQNMAFRFVLAAALVAVLWYDASAAPPSESRTTSSGAKSAKSGGKGIEVIAASASRYAVLVGVNYYEKCDDLKYCTADVTALGGQLVKIGFDRRDIVVLTDGEKIRPSRRNILEQLDATLSVADPRDLIVVALSGHGAMIGGRSYFCPQDARPNDPEGTMILIEDLFAKLQKCPARLKMVFIDACRNKFLPVESRPLADQQKSIDGFAKSLSDGAVPKGVVLLASCTSGERSWEDKGFGHGVFMHFLLQGLSGKADQIGGDGKKDEWVSLFELCNYVSSETKRHVLRTRRVAQRPYYHTSIDLPDFRLTKVLRRPATVFTKWPFNATEASRRQEETAEAIGQPVDFTNSIDMKFKLIPAGEFMMGSPEDEKERFDNEGPVHLVRVTKPYYLGVHEVTQGQFERVMGASPWKGKEYVKEGADYAASYVSWDDAVKFCKKLSAKESRTYRLPTEAEWEYACRAGSHTQYCFGDSNSVLGDFAWYDDNAYFIGEKYAHRVGQKRSNAWGFYDMHGNVWEWCADWYDSDYYANSPTADTTGAASGSQRIFRGGSWYSLASHCRLAVRNRYAPGYRRSFLGFRVALVPSE